MKIWYGIHPGYEEFILQRIKESAKRYTKQEQRAELLLRNSHFIREYRTLVPGKLFDETGRWREMVAKETISLNEKYPSLQSGETDLLFYDRVAKKITGFIRFCDQWRISREWNGAKSSLYQYVKVTPDIIYDPFFVGGNINFNTIAPCPDDRDPSYLLIKIDPWTSLDDIKASWHHIEELKKAIFGYSDKEKWNFGQALCWYDLHKKERWGYGKIASVWIQEAAPHIKDEISFRITVREGIKRIDRYIKRLTPLMEIINIPQKSPKPVK